MSEAMELPAGWGAELLGQLTSKIGSGSTPRGGSEIYQQHGTPLIRSMNVHFGGFKYDGLAFIDDIEANKLKAVEVRANDVLLNITGASIGRVTVAPKEMDGARVNQHVAIVRVLSDLDSNYVRYFLSSPDLQALITETESGVTRQALTKEKIENFVVPIPPLAEQKRIADKLDALLAKVDACRARLDRVPLLLKRFRQAVLAAATSGELTREWRVRQTKSDDFCTATSALGNVAKFIDYRGKTPQKVNSGIPLITAKNIRSGFVSEEPREYIETDEYNRWMTRGIPILNDVLITTEAPLGNVALVDWTYKFALAQRVICLQFNSSLIVGNYAALLLQASAFQANLISQATGSTVSGIKASRLKEITIEFPSLSEQREIVRRVEALFALADRIEARYTAARAQVDRLTPALLAKAFRGELVPQDPNDEPASALLARIRQSQEGPLFGGEAATTPKKRKVKTKD